jgi:hypothetical protein
MFNYELFTEAVGHEIWTFNELPEGHIRCTECETKNWCEHIAYMVSDNGDTSQIFDEGQAKEFHIKAPLFPSLNIWEDVAIIASETIPGAKEVWRLDGSTPFQLGYLHAGEGRNAIRSLFFDWFTAEYATEVFTCRAGTHKPAQETALRQMMSDERGFLMARIAIWKDKQCPPCIRSSMQDFSDLVPEDERANPWAS